MEREQTLVNLQQEPKDKTPEDVHANLMMQLSRDISNEMLTSIKDLVSKSGKLGNADVEGIGNFALLWDSLQRLHLVAVGKYGVLYETFEDLKLEGLAAIVKEADNEIRQMKEELVNRQATPEPEEPCSSCQYEDEENIRPAEYKCTKCEKNNFLCSSCASMHGSGLGHTDFIVELYPGRNRDNPNKGPKICIEELLQLPEDYYQTRAFDKATFLFELAFPARPKCHFAYSLTISHDMGVWRHLVLARCFGEIGQPAETLMAFSFDGKFVYINSKDIAHNSCHLIPRGEKELMILRKEEPNIRITNTAARTVVRDIYIQRPLQKVWTVDTCGNVIYIVHGEGKSNSTSLIVADITGNVLTTMPTGKQGFVICDKRQPRVVVLSNTTITVYDWKNERLQEATSGEHGMTKFDIWDICAREEILLVGLSTIGDAPWEVVVYQMTIHNNGGWVPKRIQLMKEGEKITIRSFCSPKLSFCQNRLMLGYKFPIETYRVEIFELRVVDKRQK